MSPAPLAITGLGAVTPVGLSAPATCAALRAGIGRLLPFEGWDDSGAVPDDGVVAGRAPLEWLRGDAEQEWPGHARWNLKLPRPQVLIAPDAARLADLALPAAEEAWARAGAPRGRLGLYLGVAEEDEPRALAGAIREALGVSFATERADRLGRAAGLAALHRAARHLREDRVDVALVGAVDSRLRRDVLERMKEAGTLRDPDHPAGVIPGEAAVFLVLEPSDRAGRPLGTLLGSAIAEEPTAATGEPNQGRGLTQAIRGARAAAGDLAKRPCIVCDLNGERYRTLEWGLVSVRALGDLHSEPGGPESAQLWHPADSIGDSGAGSGGVAVAWATTALREGHARASRALVWGASDGPLRAAAILGIAEE
jgi:3-oxoacyl-[acyl-carrier-protein] synthase-1